MTLEDLRALVAQGESERLDFKKSTGELEAGLQTLCAFLNGSGGQVFFGVTDSGAIRGQDVTDPTLREVATEIRRLEPPARLDQVRVPVGGTKEVLVVATTERPHAPYTYDGRPYKRIGSTTSLMPRPEYHDLLLARTNTQHRWENQFAEGYTTQDIDTREVDRMLRAAVEVGRLESTVTTATEALDKLGLRVNGHLLRAAVVAFGKRMLPDFPQCSLRMARFRGTTKTEFLDQRQVHGHAFLLLDEATLFLRRHLPVAGRFESGRMERIDEPIFPPLALREALVNAFCHRDYSIVGGAVSLAVFDDRLEISSTGLLPQGITVADLKREHASRLRNPSLAHVFYRRGLVEQWGRGTQKIVELCRAAGHPEPEFEERSGEVVVRFLPSGYVPPLRVSHDLTDRQRKLLEILGNGARWRFQDIYDRLENPPAPRTLREDMELLREFGLVESGGRGPNARWWITPVG